MMHFADEFCDMAFGCSLMKDPVVAADGFTYDRESIELWMKGHNTSPHTNEPFEHKILTPSITVRKLIAAWCEQSGLPAPSRPVPRQVSAIAGAVAMQQLSAVMCATHPKEPLRVFCRDCGHGVCVLCAVDCKRCKAHATEALDTMMEELRADKEGWVSAEEECNQCAVQVCAVIQADADNKKLIYSEAIDSQALALQKQVRSAAASRCSAMGAIVEKRQEREQAVVAAVASPDLAVKGSASAATVTAALDRVKAPVAPAAAVEYRAACAPTAALGDVIEIAAIIDPEDEAKRAAAVAAATAASAAAALAALDGSVLLKRVHDRNKVKQFNALLKHKLPGKGFRLLYTWGKDGRSAASFHQRCDNQVCLYPTRVQFRHFKVDSVTQGPTLVIVRSTTGHTFGGYAAAAWHSQSAYISAAGCFLYLVENPHGDAPTYSPNP